MKDLLSEAIEECKRIEAEMAPIQEALDQLSHQLYEAEIARMKVYAEEIFGLSIGSKVKHKTRPAKGFIVGFEPHYAVCNSVRKDGTISEKAIWNSKIENLEVIE